MCGITLIAGKDSVVNETRFEQIALLLDHRGPDFTGYSVDEVCGKFIRMAHNRLAIRDLSADSHQPFGSSRIRMLYNGELYGLNELKNRFGNNKRYNSDTQLLYDLLSDNDFKEVLSELNGMFAIVWLDITEGKIYFCRDRLGIKPLFFHVDTDGLVISSELAYFTSEYANDSRLNRRVLGDLINFGYSQTDDTIIEGVKSVKAGVCYSFCLTTFKVDEVCDYQLSRANSKRSFEIQDLDNLMQEVVTDQVLSDVKTGVLLSSGIDSNLVASYVPKNIAAFTLGLKDTERDESEVAERSAKLLKLNSYVANVDINYIHEKLVRTVGSLSEPICDPGVLLYFVICEEARKEGFKVLLSSDGGDELLFGYSKYRRLFFKYYLVKYMPFSLRKWVAGLFFRNSRISNWLTSNMSSFLFEVEKLTLDETISRIIEQPYSFDELHDRCDNLDDIMYHDLTHYMSRNVLRKADIASMKTSVEVRVPILDNRIVDYLTSIKNSEKLNRKMAKLPFRKLLHSKKNSFVLNMPKRGFGLPLLDWYVSGLLDGFITDYIVEPSGAIGKGYLETISKTPKLSEVRVIWNLITINIWLKENGLI